MAFTLLAGATIYDGSGNAPFTGNVLLDDARVAAAGVTPQPASARRIDCAGLAIAPGFIDLHSHSDLQVLEDRREKLLQGVTTEVVGNCGFSPYPSGPDPAALREFANGIFRGGDGWSYSHARAYFDALEHQSHLAGVHSLTGHGSLRVALFGARQGLLSPSELDRLEGELSDSLSAGAAGFSTGLMYAPGSSAPLEEIERLCRATARQGKLYATHMRSYSFQLLESVDEQLLLARRTGCRLQISHLQAVGRLNWDKQRRALDRIEAASAEGVDVEFDIYPYTAGSTVLTQLLPQSALEGGAESMLARLASRDTRRRIADEMVAGMAQQWSDVFISSVDSAANQPIVGKNLEQIAALRSVAPADAVIDLLLEEKGAANIVSFNQSEDNLRELLSHPLCSVISDGFYVKGRPHPRLHGTFPYLLGEIARRRGWLPLETAIRKITAQPAARLHLNDRGRIAPGMPADLTVFDPGAVDSPATYDSPELAPAGIRHVFRDGRDLLATASS